MVAVVDIMTIHVTRHVNHLMNGKQQQHLNPARVAVYPKNNLKGNQRPKTAGYPHVPTSGFGRQPAFRTTNNGPASSFALQDPN